MTKNLLEEEIKQKTLIDNTAQEIFNHLNEIGNQREIYEKCWIWELMQNALDTAPSDRKIEVEIIKNDTQIIFRHNGRPFKREEVSHLIYHGSTKGEQDIGKFGTGFITSHLLSKKIIVNGVREDNKSFSFELDRESNSPDGIKTKMEETWETYQKSLVDSKSASTSYSAEYKYPLNDISLKTVEAGIEDLTKIAPYVLAFNDKLGCIKITENGSELKFELVNESNETAYTQKTIKQKREAQIDIDHELWIIKNEDVEIAIKGKKENDETYQIDDLFDIPKIFLAFPLFGTRDLSFPAVINSRKFKPTAERDGIFLGREDTDDIKQNKKLLEEANELFGDFISSSDSNKWSNLHVILKFSCPPEWLKDKDWYNSLLKTCIEGICKSKVLKTELGTFINLNEGLIPNFDGLNEGKVKILWDICYRFLNYKKKMPAKELAFEWMQIINGWKFLDLDLITKIEITIVKIAALIEECGSLKDFKNELSGDVDEIDTLNVFYGLLLGAEKRELLDEKNIVPDQNGILTKKTQLHKDEGIDEILKDISDKLKIGVRSQLLHLSIDEVIQNLLSVKKQEEVLDQISSKIKQSSPDDIQYVQANIELFDWLLKHNKFECFDGYPVLSSKDKTFTSLSKQLKGRLLAPKEIWNETAKKYAELFPQEFIVSSLYYEKNSNRDDWNKLENETLILTDPLYNENEKLSQDNLESLLSGEKLDEEKEHEIMDDVAVSKIAFLDTEDIGIIETMRKTKNKARKFLEFLFVYIIEKDNKWDCTLEVSCGCGINHRIYPAFWMARLKNRKWVPIKKDKSDIASAQNLAVLFEGEGHGELI